jgi:hypothetical protein
MPMTSFNLRLARAKVHLDELGKKVRLFIESKPYRITPHDDLEGQHYKIIIKMDDPPLDAALILGDFVNCLRSCLDNLVWQMAASVIYAAGDSDTQAPSKRLSFPICKDNTLDSQLLITKATFGIPEEAISIIKSLQPYHSRDAFDSSPLWVLNELWSIDKHRHIALHSAALQLHFLSVPPFPIPKPISIDTFEDHYEMVFLLSDKPNVKFEPRDAELDFGSSSDGIVLNFNQVVEIYEFVRDSVLPKFASFFS